MSSLNRMIVLVAVFVFLLLLGTRASYATDYYISPNGDDSKSGISQGDPWKTFDRAWTDIYPGDTLWLMDGTYRESLAPNVRNGEPGSPITVKAQNDGQAIIDGEKARIPVSLKHALNDRWVGDWYVVEGIVAKDSSGTVYQINGDNVILRRVSGYNANEDANTHVFTLYGEDVLLEDAIAMGTGRKMAFSYDSINTTIRRTFANWQEYTHRIHCNEYKWGNDLEFYNTGHSIMENSISYGNPPQHGIHVLGNIDSASGNTPYAINNKLLGTMAIENGVIEDGTPYRHGITRGKPTECHIFYKWWKNQGWRSGMSLTTFGTQAVTKDTLVQDFFSWGHAGVGLQVKGNGTMENNRLVRGTVLNSGLYYTESEPSVQIEDLSGLTITDSYFEGTQYQGSGALLEHRYVDGVLTNEPLWPWPMQDRLLRETGVDVTGEITGILQSSGVPTGSNALPPKINPQPPQIAAYKGWYQNIFTSPVQVTLSTTETSGVIRYTLDGAEPTTTSSQYSSPITITNTTMLKAKVFVGGQESFASSAYYLIDPSQPNQPPVVEAHTTPFIFPPDKEYWPTENPYTKLVWPNNKVELYGVVTDNTFASSPWKVSSTWHVVEGPNGVTIEDPSLRTTNATFPGIGTYKIALTATDGDKSATAYVDVYVIDENQILHTIPGKIEAEEYKAGGEGIGYYDTTSSGFFGGFEPRYRDGKTDFVYAYNEFWGYAINRLSEEEWLKYDVNILQPGKYILSSRIASFETGGIYHFELDGIDITGPIEIQKTQHGINVHMDLKKITSVLPAGQHELSLVVDKAAPSRLTREEAKDRETLAAINYFEFSPDDGTAVSTPTPVPTIPGDTNNDGKVDILDYSTLINQFGSSGDNLSADFNEDGKVDILDYSVLVREFGR